MPKLRFENRKTEELPRAQLAWTGRPGSLILEVSPEGLHRILIAKNFARQLDAIEEPRLRTASVSCKASAWKDFASDLLGWSPGQMQWDLGALLSALEKLHQLDGDWNRCPEIEAVPLVQDSPLGAYRTAVLELLYATTQAGQVLSYAELARLGRCGSARSVGGAMRTNPWPLLVPCHRVVTTEIRRRAPLSFDTVKLGGFSAMGGVDTKRALLNFERGWLGSLNGETLPSTQASHRGLGARTL